MKKKKPLLKVTKKEVKKEVKKDNLEHKCKNCLLYNKEKGECKVAVLIEGQELHIPTNPEDFCHLEELGIEVNQVRFWAEDPKTGLPSQNGKGKIKIEYPDDFFGKSPINTI